MGAKTSEGEEASYAMLYGCGLLTISVLSDSFVPNLQQHIMKSVRAQRLNRAEERRSFLCYRGSKLRKDTTESSGSR